jgi:hypothetical protein
MLSTVGVATLAMTAAFSPAMSMAKAVIRLRNI